MLSDCVHVDHMCVGAHRRARGAIKGARRRMTRSPQQCPRGALVPIDCILMIVSRVTAFGKCQRSPP